MGADLERWPPRGHKAQATTIDSLAAIPGAHRPVGVGTIRYASTETANPTKSNSKGTLPRDSGREIAGRTRQKQLGPVALVAAYGMSVPDTA
eukprot:2897938-Rhodomonas_salina.2